MKTPAALHRHISVVLGRAAKELLVLIPLRTTASLALCGRSTASLALCGRQRRYGALPHAIPCAVRHAGSSQGRAEPLRGASTARGSENNHR